MNLKKKRSAMCVSGALTVSVTADVNLYNTKLEDFNGSAYISYVRKSPEEIMKQIMPFEVTPILDDVLSSPLPKSGEAQEPSINDLRFKSVLKPHFKLSTTNFIV